MTRGVAPALLCLAAACAEGDTPSAPVACAALPGELRPHHVQALGSHNSYHLQPALPLDDSHRYSHPPLDTQADLGVRAFELDVHLSDAGVFEVFHLPVIDPDTTCTTLADCLGTLQRWSDAHRCHAPLVVWLEPKDDIDAEAGPYGPLTGHITELDEAVRSLWPADRLFTPDDLRGGAPTLPDAVGAWPPLSVLQGHAMFALLDSGSHRQELLDGAPALEGRAMFADSDDPTDDHAALLKIDDAPADGRVPELVSGGFLVTSNAAEAGQTDAERAADWEATLAASTNHLATDHLHPTGDTTWVAELPGGSPRCLPGIAPQGCADADLERSEKDPP